MDSLLRFLWTTTKMSLFLGNTFCLLQHTYLKGVKKTLFMLIKVSKRRAFPVCACLQMHFLAMDEGSWKIATSFHSKFLVIHLKLNYSWNFLILQAFFWYFFKILSAGAKLSFSFRWRGNQLFLAVPQYWWMKLAVRKMSGNRNTVKKCKKSAQKCRISAKMFKISVFWGCFRFSDFVCNFSISC